MCIPCLSKKTMKDYVEKTLQDLLYEWAKVRASKRKQEFSINREDVLIPDVCPVFGTPFERNTIYAASIDRIDNKLGYVPGNVVVISLKANKLKSNASLKELQALTSWLENLN